LLEFIDNPIPDWPDLSINSFSTFHHLDKIQENATPIIYRAGWYDAGTALGAMNIFTSLSNPKRIIVGPWNHKGNFRADPFQPGDGTTPEAISMEKVHGLTTAALDAFFKEDVAPLELDLLEYYTLGENKMKNSILDLHQKMYCASFRIYNCEQNYSLPAPVIIDTGSKLPKKTC
jgi:hypothetical protein